MNQKDFTNIILIIIIVILVGVVGYFAFVKKPEPVVQQPTPPQTNIPVVAEPEPVVQQSTPPQTNIPVVAEPEPVVQQSTPPQTNIPVSPPPTSKPKLTLDILKNAEYYSQDLGKRIKLVNGTYPLNPSGGSPPEDNFIRIDTDRVVFGDLNNDAQEDAVVILVSRGGGSGTFRELAVVLNLNGRPLNVATRSLGDRTAINSLTVSSGVISVDMTPWDGGTGIRKIVNYKLSGSELVEF